MIKEKFFKLIILAVVVASASAYFLFFNKAMSNNDLTESVEVAEDEKGVANIVFVGDAMLDRYNRVLSDRNGVDHFTSSVKDVFEGNDLVVANLEGAVTDEKSVSLGTVKGDKGHFSFTFDKNSTKDFLSYNNIGLVNLGNNHILNFGEEGLLETKQFLRDSGVEYFGDPSDFDSTYTIKKINGLDIAFVNFNGFHGPKSDEVSEMIRGLDGKSDLVIVYAHWGSEYKLTPSDRQIKNARKFVDSGADLIIGTHPHVVQSIEEYKGKMIFYSLGNFVFDQYFSEDVKNELAISVSISENEIGFKLVPLRVSSQEGLSYGDEDWRNELLSRVASDSVANEDIRRGIMQGEFFIEF
ncbi:CapA family protein [Patescibacteria group bacterium]